MTEPDWLDYAVALGVSGLRLGPDFAAPDDWYVTGENGRRAAFEGHPDSPR